MSCLKEIYSFSLNYSNLRCQNHISLNVIPSEILKKSSLISFEGLPCRLTYSKERFTIDLSLRKGKKKKHDKKY